ncbi:hypothetical protein ACWEJX_37065, partial [Streptomyces sp. NPDC004788]
MRDPWSDPSAARATDAAPGAPEPGGAYGGAGIAGAPPSRARGVSLPDAPAAGAPLRAPAGGPGCSGSAGAPEGAYSRAISQLRDKGIISERQRRGEVLIHPLLA